MSNIPLSPNTPPFKIKKVDMCGNLTRLVVEIEYPGDAYGPTTERQFSDLDFFKSVLFSVNENNTPPPPSEFNLAVTYDEPPFNVPEFQKAADDVSNAAADLARAVFVATSKVETVSEIAKQAKEEAEDLIARTKTLRDQHANEAF
jgi:hypothetical protein